jgi:hypothetical protein
MRMMIYCLASATMVISCDETATKKFLPSSEIETATAVGASKQVFRFGFQIENSLQLTGSEPLPELKTVVIDTACLTSPENDTPVNLPAEGQSFSHEILACAGAFIQSVAFAFAGQDFVIQKKGIEENFETPTGISASGSAQALVLTVASSVFNSAMQNSGTTAQVSDTPPSTDAPADEAEASSPARIQADSGAAPSPEAAPVIGERVDGGATQTSDPNFPKCEEAGDGNTFDDFGKQTSTSMNLKCDDGKVIAIGAVRYEDFKGGCGRGFIPGHERCHAYSRQDRVKQAVQDKCSLRSSCEVSADGGLLDPCLFIPKRLIVWYACVPPLPGFMDLANANPSNANGDLIGN